MNLQGELQFRQIPQRELPHRSSCQQTKRKPSGRDGQRAAEGPPLEGPHPVVGPRVPLRRSATLPFLPRMTTKLGGRRSGMERIHPLSVFSMEIQKQIEVRGCYPGLASDH